MYQTLKFILSHLLDHSDLIKLISSRVYVTRRLAGIYISMYNVGTSVGWFSVPLRLLCINLLRWQEHRVKSSFLVLN